MQHQVITKQPTGTPNKMVVNHSSYQPHTFYSPIRQGNPVSRVVNVAPKVVVHGSYTPDRHTIFSQSALHPQRNVSPIMKPTIMNSSYLRAQEMPRMQHSASNGMASSEHPEEKEKESLTQQFNTLLEENQKLIKIIEQKNQELAKHKSPEQDKELSAQVADLTSQLAEEREQFQNFKTKIIMVIEENEKLQQVYEQLQQDYTTLEKNFKNNGSYGNAQHIEDLEQQIKQLRQENTHLKSSPQEHLLEQLQAENDRLQQALKNNTKYTALRQHMEEVLANY